MEQHQHLQLHRHPEGVHHCSSALLVHDLQVCRRVGSAGPPADEVVRGRSASWPTMAGSPCARARSVGSSPCSRALSPDSNFRGY